MEKVIICPFCGEHEAKVEKTFVLKYRVRCPKCNVAQLNQYDTEEEAIKEWNTRIPMERIVGELEKDSWMTEATFDEDGYCNDDSYEVVILSRAIEIVKEEMT